MMKKFTFFILTITFLLPCGNNATKFHKMCSNGSLQDVENLINNGAKVNAQDSNGDTPLHYATNNNNKEIVKLLLDNDANPNTKDDDKTTPLHLAAEHGHEEIVKLLLDSGADMKAKNNDDYGPLHLATEHGHKKVVDLLINRGADVNDRDDHNDTPLHCSTSNDNEELANLLLGSGADPKAKNNDGDTPLHYAASNSNEKIADLLEKNADVKAENNTRILRLLTATPLLLKQSNSVNPRLTQEIFKKLDVYCIDYSGEVFNLKLNSPVLDKDEAFNFFQFLPEPAVESILYTIFPIKNYIESKYIKAFLKLCYQDLTTNSGPGELSFARLFIRRFYEHHLSELKLYIAIKNNDEKTAIDRATARNKNNIVEYLATIANAKSHNELDKDLREQTESNYQLLVGYNQK